MSHLGQPVTDQRCPACGAHDAVSLDDQGEGLSCRCCGVQYFAECGDPDCECHPDFWDLEGEPLGRPEVTITVRDNLL